MSEEFDRYSKVHPRHDLVNAAKVDLSGHVDRIRREYQLTLSELFYLLGQEVMGWGGIAVESQRRGEEKAK